MGFLIGASEALQQALLENEAKRRQAMLDDMKQRELDSQIADRENSRKLQERNVTLAEENAKAIQNLRDFERAKSIVDMAGESESVTPDTEALLDRTGFGGRLKRGVPQLNVAAGVPEALGGDAPTPPPLLRGVVTLRPGFQYEQAREAAAERAALAQASREAAAEKARQDRAAAADRAQQDRESREAIARISADARRDVASVGASIRGAAAADKKQAAEDDKANKRRAAVSVAQDTMDVLNQLIDENDQLKPGVGNLFGATTGSRWIPGSRAADAEASLDQLIGKSVVGLINEMKSQSRTGATGFGALSEKELKILQDAANKLNNRWQSNESARRELVRIREKVQKVMQDNGQAAPAGTSGFKVTEIKKD